MGKFIVTVYNTQNLSLDQIHYKKKEEIDSNTTNNLNGNYDSCKSKYKNEDILFERVEERK